MQLNEIRPVIARHLRKTVRSEEQDMYTFFTKKDGGKQQEQIKIFFKYRGEDAQIDWERPGREQGDVRAGDDSSISLQIFAMIPEAIDLFLKDHPEIRRMRVGSEKNLVAVYARMIKKYTVRWGVKSVEKLDDTTFIVHLKDPK